MQELASALAEEERSALECVIHQHLPIFHTEHCVFCRFLSDGNSYLDCGYVGLGSELLQSYVAYFR